MTEISLHSMTGFASQEGALAPYTWSWELRSVNGRGLDLRLRVPDWVPGLEQALRKRLGDALGRGSVSLSLKVSRTRDETSTIINTQAVSAALKGLAEIARSAEAQGVALSPASAADIMALRGVVEVGDSQDDPSGEGLKALHAALMADFDPLLEAFIASRASEGQALHTLLDRHLSEIAALTEAANTAAEARKPAAEAAFRGSLARITSAVDDIPEERIAQELAVLAVKADVTEELGRLEAHIEAGRALLAASEPVGRRFDFLMQEFNREANTLCSKSNDTDLTAIGLDLKTKIDQLREQVQNVE